MAEHGSGGEDPIQLFIMVLGALALLVFLWFASGAYKNADLRGIFIAPPAPVGPGGSYGPQIGHPSSLAPQQEEDTNQ
jgi:hypothetical protein